MYTNFLNTFWIMLGHTIQPLDRYVNSTGRTLGLADILCISKRLVEPFNYKSPLLLQLSHALSGPQATKNPPCECVL
jgi:hypothetical protein